MSEYTFEMALARLEQIVKALDEGKTTLDESLTAFEEGIRLVKFCTEKLDHAEQRVRILTQNEDGTVAEAPFPSLEGKE